MSWIPVNERLPAPGTKVQVLCQLETEAIYDPKENVTWHHIEGSAMKANATHWFEQPDKPEGE